MRLLAILLALSAPPSARYEVHRACFECRSACRSSRTPGCDRTCLVIKASECRRRGLGPGPTTTCDCT